MSACHDTARFAVFARTPIFSRPRTFKTLLCDRVPCERQKVCTSSVGLPSPHQQPKETCPRLIWPFYFDFWAQKWPTGTLGCRTGKTLQSVRPTPAPTPSAIAHPYLD